MATSSSDLEVTVETVSACVRCDEGWDPVVCYLRVPNQLLYAWHQMKRTSSYVQLLNDAVRGHVVAVNVHCERLECHLHHRAGDIKSKVAKYHGRLRQQFLNDSTVFDVYSGEMVDASELMEKMESIVTEDIAEWVDKLEGARETISSLRGGATSCSCCCICLSSLATQHWLATGTSVRVAEKTLSFIGTRVNREGLWFMESFGLSMETVTMQDQLSDAPMVLTYDERSSPAPSYPPCHRTKPCSRHYICWNVLVLDEFYHKLSIAHPSLPRFLQ